LAGRGGVRNFAAGGAFHLQRHIVPRQFYKENRMRMSVCLAALAVAALSAGAFAQTKAEVKAEARAEVRAERQEARAAKLANLASRDVGGKLGAPLALKVEKQNSPQDMLLVEATEPQLVNGSYVVELKVVWGDLNNQIKGVGKKYYSKWDGSLDLTTGTGEIDKKIQFDDKGGHALVPHNPAKAGPHEGSGRDFVVDRAGSHITWEAGVVGALDGLRIKITSSTPVVQGTLKAGNFEIPISIGTATGGGAVVVPHTSAPVGKIPAGN
jgi:hypothetical protein